MNSMKRQKDLALKDEHSRSVVPNMLLEISGEIIPERMKRWSQRKKQQPVVDMIGHKSQVDAVKSKTA